jgi:quercetin dioxygenase-like cupin family protein
MKAGAILKEHTAEADVSIHVLRGAIRVTVDHNIAEFEQGQMMILSRDVRHSIEALDKTAFLHSISG